VLLRRPAEPADGLLTAAQVAARFNVDRGWVYAHAEQLGVVRLGDGPRPRLRFDPRSSPNGSSRPGGELPRHGPLSL
jgi:hypothetical protein